MRKTILAGALGAALILPAAASAGGFAVHPGSHHRAVIGVHTPIVLVAGHPQRLAFGHRRHHHDRHYRRDHCAYRGGHRLRAAHHPHDDHHYRRHARYRTFPQPGVFLSFAWHD